MNKFLPICIQFTFFVFPHNLTMMYLCIMLYTYWMALLIIIQFVYRNRRAEIEENGEVHNQFTKASDIHNYVI